MRASPISLTESYWMLFAIWGLGLAGMPADLDEEDSTVASTPPAALQPAQQGAGDVRNSRSIH